MAAVRLSLDAVAEVSWSASGTTTLSNSSRRPAASDTDLATAA